MATEIGYKYHTITVDEQGRSCIVAINGDEEAEAETFGAGLSVDDEVELDDGSIWTVERVYGHIQTGNPGSGASNYVAVDLVQRS